MSEPVIANRKPYYQELKQGRRYYWCSCGHSTRQPFCDGSHKGTGFEPVEYVAREAGEEVLFCGCKHTKDRPFCDGTHNNLPGGYAEDDPNSPENRAIPVVPTQEGPTAMLDGGCYVFSLDKAEYKTKGNFRYCRVISEAQGARYQSLFYGEIDAGASPIMGFGDRHVILFLAQGTGTVTISGREISAGTGDGVYVRPGEAFQVTPSGDAPVRLFISACPAAGEPEWRETMPDKFDAAIPRRVVGIDPARRQAMAARYFQMLVDKSIGSDVVTQFIGHIPKSKAEPHRHLYEEALIILSGEGMMWTETRKAPVKGGDVIFLPRKQLHSLEATAEAGMDVVGVIYPGDNPSINY
ncbi:MAG: cupin domain-containing protein [Alphaproteobacteria bacterium]|nr:MAG: cupin domain-containing protein [Alphaproteobacteria bacterium]